MGMKGNGWWRRAVQMAALEMSLHVWLLLQLSTGCVPFANTLCYLLLCSNIDCVYFLLSAFICGRVVPLTMAGGPLHYFCSVSVFEHIISQS